MREELVALAKLAAMDASARHVEEELRELPARIESMRADVQVLESLLAQERAQLGEAEALRGAQADDLEARRASLANARKKVAQAHNLREANAAEREVEVNRQAIRDRESELERIGEAVEAKRASLAAREAQFEEARGMFEQEERRSSSRIEELAKERDALLEGRDKLVSDLPTKLFKRYERLRQRIPDVVAVLDSETCTGCRMALPPQRFVDAQKGEIVDCPQCRRIVVYKGLLEP